MIYVGLEDILAGGKRNPISSSSSAQVWETTLEASRNYASKPKLSSFGRSSKDRAIDDDFAAFSLSNYSEALDSASHCEPWNADHSLPTLNEISTSYFNQGSDIERSCQLQDDGIAITQFFRNGGDQYLNEVWGECFQEKCGTSRVDEPWEDPTEYDHLFLANKSGNLQIAGEFSIPSTSTPCAPASPSTPSFDRVQKRVDLLKIQLASKM
jgi:hypothetical protein